jgi:hypothetical protein
MVAHFAALDGAKVSKGTILKITEKVVRELSKGATVGASAHARLSRGTSVARVNEPDRERPYAYSGCEPRDDCSWRGPDIGARQHAALVLRR